MSLCFYACSILLPLTAADQPLDTFLKQIEQHYNRAKTLQVSFNERYSIQGRARKSESGELFLRKPGRMRWEYRDPAGKLFVSDGKDIYLFVPATNRVEKMKLRDSEDMRAPLAFLLGKLDFHKEFRGLETRPEGHNTWIVAAPKSDRLPYQKVEMLVTPDYRIERLVITQDQSLLTFDLDREKLNPALTDEMFRFRMPAGAELVESAGPRSPVDAKSEEP